MEELRNGKRNIFRQHRRRLRVLVIGSGHDALREAQDYAAKGERTALACYENNALLPSCPSDIRFIPLKVLNRAEAVRAFEETSRAWREIDTVLLCDADEEIMKAIASAWTAFHRQFPRVTDTLMTLIRSVSGRKEIMTLKENNVILKTDNNIL